MSDPKLSRHDLLGRADDFPESGLREVEVAGRKILLVRRGDKITAIDGLCPHAGAPLAEGVLDGDVVICPWHKAAFSVEDGRCVAPPALDGLARFEIDVVDGDIRLLDDGKCPGFATRAADPRCFAIIGGGAAGFSAAQGLRVAGFGGRVVLIDDGDELPFDRTMLSKANMAEGEGGETSPLKDAAFYERHEIERLHGRVVGLDPAARRIDFADGKTMIYDQALVATGGTPKDVSMPGAGLDGVFSLRGARDAARIVDAAAAANTCVVIGTGFIGMEVAAGLRQRGLDVTVVGPEAAPFEGQLGAEIGNVYRRIHEENGVKFRLGEKVEALFGEGRVRGVRLASGEEVPADFVVAGLGVVPVTAFVKDVARRDDQGLTVDAQLKVADGLYAAGDIAAFPLRGDGERVRVEHWRVAEQQGRVAALNMLSGAVVFDAVPVFWTTQYKQRLDYVGHASGDDDVVVRGDLVTRTFIAYYVRNGVVAAAAGMNCDRDMAAILALITVRRDWAVDKLHPGGASPVEVLRRLAT
jgi:NADPH-dependent 2,4-dienoyl-CoA reductase/sulfur reductase-like enzyme/nitrite reductase/ring-hydroxylating ferredoxin subunit